MMSIENATDQNRIKYVVSAVLLLVLAVVANQYWVKGADAYFSLVCYSAAFCLIPALVFSLNYYPLRQLIEERNGKWPEAYAGAKPILKRRLTAYIIIFSWIAMEGSWFCWQANKQGFIPTKNAVAGIMFLVAYAVLAVAFVLSSNAEIRFMYFLRDPNSFAKES